MKRAHVRDVAGCLERVTPEFTRRDHAGVEGDLRFWRVVAVGDQILVHRLTCRRAERQGRGLKLVASMVTLCTTGLAGWVPGRCAAPGATQHTISIDTANSALICRSLSGGERLLQTPGVLQVGNERRPHLDDQRLQFCILRVRHECLVDRFEDLRVVRHLVVHIRLVKCGTLERLQLGDILLAAGFQCLARGIVPGE